MNQNQTVTMPLNDPFGKATTGKLGMWLFIIIDGLSFSGLLIAGAALRVAANAWPVAGEILNIPLTAFNTFLLICTSFTMVMALNAIQKGNQAGLKKYLTYTMIGGGIFLGIQVYEYYHLISDGFFLNTSIYSGVFYVTTCFHGMHVLSGVIYISFILYAASQGRYSENNWNHVEILGLFWHFVDLVWILVFTVIYLI
ncbi:MAG TPA: cytochrome c oxidase subunit 3 [Candidatus Marinimicrobia bacterium]|jgi:heme/copper-type cytochrome/quinol oxidase subunit 3|nr:cytochrome c oxidase subunit 3 [Candidatus Neomarinimicrobiota bacterium]|tara:strand:+ start:3263 stop:3856 length:594 start_codon:yes stop_codon:yes gene_type:complete